MVLVLDQVDGEASSSTGGGKKLNNWRAASPPDPPMVKSYTPLVTKVGIHVCFCTFKELGKLYFKCLCSDLFLPFCTSPLVMPSKSQQPSVSKFRRSVWIKTVVRSKVR